MSVEPVGFLPPSQAISPIQMPALDAAASGKSDSTFATWFSNQVQQVNKDMAVADSNLQSLATGENTNLHQVMISLEEARLSFQLLMQVRNRVLEAYQEVMRMQV